MLPQNLFRNSQRKVTKSFRHAPGLKMSRVQNLMELPGTCSKKEEEEVLRGALAIINVLNKYVMMVVLLPVSRFVFSPPQFIFSKDSNLGEQCFLARFFTFRGSTRNSLNIGYEQFRSKNKKGFGITTNIW